MSNTSDQVGRLFASVGAIALVVSLGLAVFGLWPGAFYALGVAALCEYIARA